MDNNGSRTTGRFRTRADIRPDDPLGYGSRLSLNGLTTEAGLLHSGGARLLLYGSHTDYELGKQFAPLNLHGRADRFGVNLRYPLLLQPGRLVQLELGWQRENFHQYSDLLDYDKRSHITQLHLGLSGVYADASGGTTYAPR